MGKKRNRRKRNEPRSPDVEDRLMYSFGIDMPSEDGQSLELKTETKSLRHDEKARDSTSVGKVLNNSVSTASSTKCEYAQYVGCSDQKKSVHKDCVNGTAKSSFLASEARKEGKLAPVVQPLSCGRTSLKKVQQMAKSSAIKNTGNLPKEGEKDDLRGILKSDIETFVPFNRVGRGKINNDIHSVQSNYADPANEILNKIKCDSPVRSQREFNYRCGGNSFTSHTSVESCSSKVGAIAKTNGIINREVSGAGTVTGRSAMANTESLQTARAVTKSIEPVQFKSEKFSSSGPEYDIIQYNGISQILPSSGSKTRCARSNSSFSSATSGSPAGNPKNHFKKALNQWLEIRNGNIRKLQKLLDNALSNEAFYDNIELNCKYGSVLCKKEKISAPTVAWGLIPSFGSIFCDIASGLSSVVHMCSTDGIQSEFQQVMDMDATATKEMYEARSRCITEYRYTDEIIRKFGGTTLGETLGKISESVGITEFFQIVKKANDNKEDIAMAAVSALEIIINKNSNRDVGREVFEAVQDLVESNPACVGMVSGVGRSLYGAADLRMAPVKGAGKVGAVVKAGTMAVDLVLLKQDLADIEELQRKIRYGSKSTVGKNIQEALDMFIQERNEMRDLLYEL